MAAGAENGEKSAVGRPSGRIWRIQGTPINTGPAGEVFVDVRAAESARNVLNGPYGGKNRPFWPFFDYFLQKRVASLPQGVHRDPSITVCLLLLHYFGGDCYMAKANVVNVNVGVLGHVDSGKTSVVGGPRST